MTFTDDIAHHRERAEDGYFLRPSLAKALWDVAEAAQFGCECHAKFQYDWHRGCRTGAALAALAAAMREQQS